MEVGEGTFVGTVNEDFAIESLAGDIFLLGNTSWRIEKVTSGEVLVSDAKGAPPSIPFWLGEAPGRTVELSAELSDLRRGIADRVQVDVDSASNPQSAIGNPQWLDAVRQSSRPLRPDDRVPLRPGPGGALPVISGERLTSS